MVALIKNVRPTTIVEPIICEIPSASHYSIDSSSNRIENASTDFMRWFNRVTPKYKTYFRVFKDAMLQVPIQKPQDLYLSRLKASQIVIPQTTYAEVNIMDALNEDIIDLRNRFTLNEEEYEIFLRMVFYKTLSLYNVIPHTNKGTSLDNIYTRVLDCPAVQEFVTLLKDREIISLLKRNFTKTEVEQFIKIYVEFTSKDGSYLYDEFDGFINDAGGRLNAVI